MASVVQSESNAIDNGEELMRLAQALREALTDNMVERLATTAGVALEVVDRLNEEDTRAAIHNVLDRLAELHRLGAIETLFETVLLLHAMRSAATDSIVERLFAFIEQLVNTLGSDAVSGCASDVIEALDEAAQETRKNPAGGGLLSTLALLGKPESQQSLRFLLKFGESLARTRES